MTAHPNLAAALAAACAHATGAPKDSRHQQGYAYASAESVLGEARAALSAHGVSVVPVSSEIEWTGTIEATSRDGRSQSHDVGTLRRSIAVIHGIERIDAALDWPVVCGPGRPRDKAVAGALTSSLSYFVRDLLLLPRLTEDQLDARTAEHDAAASAPVSAPDSAPAKRQRKAAVEVETSHDADIREAKALLRAVPADHGKDVVGFAALLAGADIAPSKEIFAGPQAGAFARVLLDALVAVKGDASAIHTHLHDLAEAM